MAQHKVSGEFIAAFIDAVYAIAATILVLEIPGELGADFDPAAMGELLLDYAISFVILFALWLQHRRINGEVQRYGQAGLWLNGVVLMLVCLIPRATTFVFEYGGDVTVTQIERSLFHGAAWTVAELVDVFYLIVVLLADLALLALAVVATRGRRDPRAAFLKTSKLAVSAIVLGALSLSLLTPLENRYFLFVIPALLIFERNIAGALLARQHRRRS